MLSEGKPAPLRILAVAALEEGANDYAFVRAFRRAGHSVQVVPTENYIPRWERKSLRALRRLLTPAFVAEYNQAMVRTAKSMRPDLLFVFKGQYLTKEAMDEIKATGTIAIQFYPDTGFADHGPYLPETIGRYDWVFTTKPAGIKDLKENYGANNASFVPHAFDPEVHAPVRVNERDKAQYQCDVSFIGNISPKKRKLAERVRNELPHINFKLWGARTWGSVAALADCYQGAEVWGREYAKAIQESRINLGLLFEGGPSAPESDRLTARTFEIPAVGGFMLHERTDEAMRYFEDEKECAFYRDPDDLIGKIRYFLDHPEERRAIAKGGQERCLNSGYSVDDRVKTVLAKYHELRSAQVNEAQ